MFLATHHSSSGSRIALEAGLQHPEEFDDFVYQGNNRPPTSLFIAAAVAGSNSSVANADSAVDNFSEDEETLRIRRHERALRNRQAQYVLLSQMLQVTPSDVYSDHLKAPISGKGGTETAENCA